MNVMVTNCRQSGTSESALAEPCEPLADSSDTIEPILAATESVSSTSRPKSWKTEQRRLQKLPADKRRTPLNNSNGQQRIGKLSL